MRSSPPAVDVTLGPGRRERALVASLHAVSFTVMGAWMAAQFGLATGVVGLASGALGACLGWQSFRPLRGSLRWDGQGWWHGEHSGSAHALHSVSLMMDLGGWMLLRAQTEPTALGLKPGCWCGVAAGDVGAGWHGMRVALYHGRGEPGPVATDRTAG